MLPGGSAGPRGGPAGRVGPTPPHVAVGGGSSPLARGIGWGPSPRFSVHRGRSGSPPALQHRPESPRGAPPPRVRGGASPSPAPSIPAAGGIFHSPPRRGLSPAPPPSAHGPQRPRLSPPRPRPRPGGLCGGKMAAAMAAAMAAGAGRLGLRGSWRVRGATRGRGEP